MKMNILAIATGLSDRDLLARLGMLAERERDALVELVAHLAALDSRPAVYAAQGHSSLFSYCTHALRLSEDAACNRIEAARACRRFPVILDLLSSGEVSLTAVRLLGRHLTPENHRAVLDRARGRSRQQIEILVAELAPRPDVPTSVRRLPTSTAPPLSAPAPATSVASSDVIAAGNPSAAFFAPAPRPIVQPTAPERYAAPAAGTPSARNPGWRSGRHLRPSGDPIAGQSREAEARSGHKAPCPDGYPSWDG
jgi:hypothetical protein